MDNTNETPAEVMLAQEAIDELTELWAAGEWELLIVQLDKLGDVITERALEVPEHAQHKLALLAQDITLLRDVAHENNAITYH